MYNRYRDHATTFLRYLYNTLTTWENNIPQTLSLLIVIDLGTQETSAASFNYPFKEHNKSDNVQRCSVLT